MKKEVIDLTFKVGSLNIVSEEWVKILNKRKKIEVLQEKVGIKTKAMRDKKLVDNILKMVFKRV